jgi:hypothetical protein
VVQSKLNYRLLGCHALHRLVPCKEQVAFMVKRPALARHFPTFCH